MATTEGWDELHEKWATVPQGDADWIEKRLIQEVERQELLMSMTKEGAHRSARYEVPESAPVPASTARNRRKRLNRKKRK